MFCYRCKDEGIIPDEGAKPPYKICNNAVYCDCIIGKTTEEAYYKSCQLVGFGIYDEEDKIIFN